MLFFVHFAKGIDFSRKYDTIYCITLLGKEYKMTLYISDLDGTLLTSSGKMKPRAKEMLNDMIENGLNFTYCTARSINSAGNLMKNVKISLPVILQNGVFIYDPKKEEFIVKNFPGKRQTELLSEAVTRLEERPMIHSFIDGKIRISYLGGSKNLKNYLKNREGDERLRPLESYSGLFDGEFFYAVFINPVHKAELDEVFTIENGFSHVYYRDVYTNDYWYEVFSSSASKANAVLQLKALLGADEIVSFGDNHNDISMFSISDRCYAVENAFDDVKSAADGVIGSNDSLGVPAFIECEHFVKFDYIRPESCEPDPVRFTESVEKALARERSTIGTLNEKTIHNALKCYYCNDVDHEAKIGSFYADGAGEDGIYEIQTAAFSKLGRKLSKMLRACHVTVVYPYPKIVHNYSMNEQTDEIISSSTRRNSSLSKFFLELYRIKEFLTNPNLTICIAQLEIEQKAYYKDERRIRYKGMKKEKIPKRYIKEIRLDSKTDYFKLLPDGLPQEFTKKELHMLLPATDPSLMLEVLEYVGAVSRVGKRGKATVYAIRSQDIH